MKTLPVGLQIYTVRDFAEKNFKATMQAIKDMGYDYVEAAGFYGMNPADMRKIFDDIGLIAISAHVALADLNADLEKVIDDYITIGCKYIAIPYLDDGLRPGQDGFKQVLDDIVKIGKACKDKGVILSYHNHDFEFVKVEGDVFGFDYMYETISPEYLQTQIDTCWVKVAGECPAAYIKKYAGRCPTVHLKDFVGSKSENMYELIGIDKKAEANVKFGFKPVGYGVQDFPPILEAAVASGAEYVIVEQDNSNDCTSLEAAKKSREYLKSLGW
ncbi:MAG: sugar phosphate isomerase/epimerase [Oscillospiraceae bacterium]|nr:sugar phosphate isomerase/epimerase [Oscillospiraceae bacterium]